MKSINSTQSGKRPRAVWIAAVVPLVVCAVNLLVAILFPLPDWADEARPTASGDVAYVTGFGGGFYGWVALVDTASHTVIGLVDVGAAGCDSPVRAAISPAGDFVYVSCDYSGNVAVIETTGNTVVTTVDGIHDADGIAFTRDGAYALVGSELEHQIAVIDTATYALSFIPTPAEPRSIVAHPYMDRAYATCADGTILLIDTTTFSILTAIPVGNEPWDVAVSPDGRWVFVSDQADAGLAVIDTSSDSLYTTVTGLGRLTGLEVAPDGSEVYACGGWNGVHVVDGLTFQHITTVSGVEDNWEAAVTCDGTELYVSAWVWEIPVIDTTTYSITDRIPMPSDARSPGIAICPQHVASGLVLSPPAQTNSGARGEVVARQEILVNATGTTDSFSLTLGSRVWETALSTDSLGPIADGDSAAFTLYVTVPVDAAWYSTDIAVVTATSVTSPTVYSDTAAFTTQAYAPPQISVSPGALTSIQVADQVATKTLLISNGNGVTMTFELAELGSPFATRILSPADLAGKRILYDHAHGEPTTRVLSTLIGDAAGAGAEVNLNWTYPVDASILEGYDVLWVNCCGDTPWASDELNAVSDWLAEGGAVFVHGESSPATDGPASVYGISYQPDDCVSGTTTNITEHPTSEGVHAVVVGHNCHSLATGGGADIVVYDPLGQPHVVAQEQGSGRMVVVASEDFVDGTIDYDYNRLLANNILAWLASPTYSDVPWLSETPESGIVLSQSSLPLTVAFDSTGLSLGEYQATLAVEYNDPIQPFPIEVPVTLTVVAEGAGLSLAPPLQKGNAPPGETVVYNLTVINLGSYTDTFTLEASGLWTPTLAVGSIGPLGVAERSAFTLEVAIPATAEAGSSDLATITARSESDAEVSSNAQVTTTAQAPPRYLPLILKNGD